MSDGRCGQYYNIILSDRWIFEYHHAVLHQFCDKFEFYEDRFIFLLVEFTMLKYTDIITMIDNESFF